MGLSYRYGYFAADSKPDAKVGGFNQVARIDHQSVKSKYSTLALVAR